MPAKKSLICLSLFLAACSGQAAVDTSHGLDVVQENASVTWNKARTVAGFPEKAPKKPTIRTQARYCYRDYEDITCYSQPILGQENRLVAYQGDAGQTGYVLPERHYSVGEDGKLLPLQSVNVDSAPETSSLDNTSTEDPNKHLKEIHFDPAELLPKTLVPQKQE